MFKVFATNVVVSKGYGENPTFKFSDNENIVNFRIGKKVYDPKADDNTRWINVAVKAFGDICERIKKMKLKEGSSLNIEGKLDEDVWDDESTGEVKRRTVIILTDVEYASSGSGSGNSNKPDDQSTEKPKGGNQTGNKKGSDSSNFTGFSDFGGENPFFGN